MNWYVKGLLQNARSWVSDFQDETKLALGYLLTFQRDRAERYWDAVLPPTDITEPPALFFEWLWEELFGEDDFRLLPGDYDVVTQLPGPPRRGKDAGWGRTSSTDGKETTGTRRFPFLVAPRSIDGYRAGTDDLPTNE